MAKNTININLRPTEVGLKKLGILYYVDQLKYGFSNYDLSVAGMIKCYLRTLTLESQATILDSIVEQFKTVREGMVAKQRSCDSTRWEIMDIMLRKRKL